MLTFDSSHWNKAIENFIDRTVTMKFLYEKDINKSNATEYVQKHSSSCVITFHIVSKRREVQLLGMEICKCPQIFELGCCVRTWNWSFWDCGTQVMPLLLSDIIPSWIPMGFYSTVIGIWRCTVIFSPTSPVVAWNFSFKRKLLNTCIICSP